MPPFLLSLGRCATLGSKGVEHVNIKDFLSNITTSQVTFWIAIAGFLMSLISWIKDFATQHKRLSARIMYLGTSSRSAHMYLMIENKSRLPISITGVELILDKQAYPCVPFPKIVFIRNLKTAGEVSHSQPEYSTQIPIHIPSLGAVTALLLFDPLVQTPLPDATQLTLAISTNRGKKVKMRLPLSAECRCRKLL